MYKKNFKNMENVIKSIDKLWDEIDMEYLTTDEKEKVWLHHRKAINEIEKIKDIFIEVVIRREESRIRNQKNKEVIS